MRHVVLALLLAVAAARPCRAGYVLDLDYAAFRADDSLAFVEVYTGIQRSSLTYRQDGDTLKADFMLLMEVLQDSVVVVADTLSARDLADSAQSARSPGQFFAHVFRVIMKPGTYGLRASLFQWSPEPLDVVTETMTVRALDAAVIEISGIELGTDLQFSEEKSPLMKSGVRVVPNPTRFYGTQVPLLYYYAEVYGMDFDSARADSHEVTRRIIDAELGGPARPDVVKSYGTRGASVVVADGFPVTTLRTGTYFLELEVKSVRTGRTATARKKFWTYRREDFTGGQVPVARPEYQARLAEVRPDFLQIVDADSALLWMRYVLAQEDLNRVGRLTPDGKRSFLISYWRERDLLEAGTSDQYFARVAEANHRYGFLKRQGWKTDRGRVLILYGEADRIQHNYAAADMPDHEIWEYDRLDGGVVFVFFDRSGFGDLDLVHSTKRGEIYNPNWNELAPTSRRQPGDAR